MDPSKSLSINKIKKQQRLEKVMVKKESNVYDFCQFKAARESATLSLNIATSLLDQQPVHISAIKQNILDSLELEKIRNAV